MEYRGAQVESKDRSPEVVDRLESDYLNFVNDIAEVVAENLKTPQEKLDFIATRLFAEVQANKLLNHGIVNKDGSVPFGSLVEFA